MRPSFTTEYKFVKDHASYRPKRRYKEVYVMKQVNTEWQGLSCRSLGMNREPLFYLPGQADVLQANSRERRVMLCRNRASVYRMKKDRPSPSIYNRTPLHRAR